MPALLPTRSTSRITLAAPLLALALAACTGGGDGGDPAASGPAAGGSSAAPTFADRDGYDLALARCLREGGLDIADPAPGEGIQEPGWETTPQAETCSDQLGTPPAPDDVDMTDEEARTYQLTFAACLRGLGYDVPDPTEAEPFFVPAEVTEADFDTCEPAY